jgi:hypothetical protein
MEITNCIKFKDYLRMSKEVTDKVGFLTLVFKRLYEDMPESDLVNTGGRIAQLWSLCHKDTGYFLKILWIASSESPCGSYLNYIQAIIKKNAILISKQASQQSTTKLKRVN